jgi:formylglycine-generating enzyme required for sulfatase activity
VERAADGSVRGTEEKSANDFTVGVAQFLTGMAGSATLHHAGLAAASRWFRANGTAYAVTPCPRGESLAEKIHSAGKLTAPQVAAVAMPVLEALEYLHGQEIIHQELNPRIIQIPESGGAVLLGIGGGARPGHTLLPADHPTQVYGAIEQFLDAGKIGPWTDIYCLAATLYHAISGNAPAPSLQRWAAIQTGAADPLLPLELPATAGESQREVAALINRGLAIDPAARPQSVREWRTRVERVTGAAGDQGSAQEPASGKARDWRGVILLTAFFAGLALLAWFVLSSRWSDAQRASEPATATVAAASAEEKERWRAALEVDAVVGYRAFLEDFPASAHREQALEHIDMLENKAWESVVAEGARAAFEAHLETFPEGVHATLALARIEEFKQEEARLARERDALKSRDDEAWNAARAAASITALDGYISAWPGGLHVAEAHSLRQSLQGGVNDTAAFAVASKANTIEAYRTYIKEFPSGRKVAAAQEAIESLTLRPGKAFRDCSDCPLMVVIPAGAFWQGTADASKFAISLEKPRRRVTIDQPFAMAVHETTMAEWDACVADGGCETRPADNGWGRGDRPVMLVSWIDAQQYAAWLSKKTSQAYSLPSESAWEYVARAGEEGEWPGGDAALLCAYANIAGEETRFEWRHRECADSSAFATLPVGSLKGNAFGVYDAIGNVAEWTLDCMNLSYLEAPVDGSAWAVGMCSSHMTRGGSWFTGSKESRLGARFNLKNGDRNDFTGFRLVRKVEKQ